MKKFCFAMGLLAAAPLMAQVLHERPIITDAGLGPGGADASRICLGGNIFGHSILGTIPFRVADKFTVPASDTAGWDVNEVCIYTYQTGATAASITGATLNIIEGGADPSLGTSVWGDDSTNVMSSVAMTNIYRTNGIPGDTQRRLQLVKITISPALHLDAGKDYWLSFNMTGTVASGPWHPPSTDPTIACLPGNAMQWNAGWLPIHSDNLVPFATPQCASTFVVKGEKTSACYPDCEGDGDLDVFDYLCFLGAYANQDPYADCEGDGDWDVFDFLCFQGKYSSGC